MQIHTFTDNQEWLEARKKRITGSRVKNVIELRKGAKKKKDFYELIAERIALPPTAENPMDRGHRLEDEAVEKFIEQSGIELKNELVMWTRDDNEYIAISPDAYSEDLTIAGEVKCLDSARHIEALLLKVVPLDYKYQVLQYFIVNDKLEKLYFIFYDPRLTVKKLFWLEINREDVEKDIEKYLKEQRYILANVEEIVLQLTF